MATVSSATGGAALWGYFFVHGQVITLPYLVAATTSLVQFMFMFICRRFVILFPQGFSRSQKSRFGPVSGDVFTSPTQQSPSLLQDPHNDALIWRSYILPYTYQSRPT